MTPAAAGKATVDIVGRADLAFMPNMRGGIICLFASGKAKYLKDHNGKYANQYELVAVGGSEMVPGGYDKMPIQLGKR